MGQIQSDLADLRQRLDALSTPDTPTVAGPSSPPPVATVAPCAPRQTTPPARPLCEELLASRDSDSESEEGESSVARASRRLRRPTISMAGSLAAALLFNPSTPDAAVPVANSVDPRLKLRIRQGLFVPIEVLLASEQGKPVNHYLKNPFLTPVNDPKLAIVPTLIYMVLAGVSPDVHVWPIAVPCVTGLMAQPSVLRPPSQAVHPPHCHYPPPLMPDPPQCIPSVPPRV